MFKLRSLVAIAMAAGLLCLATDAPAKPAGDKGQGKKAQDNKPQQRKAADKDKKAKGKKPKDKKGAEKNKKGKDAPQKFDNPVGKKFKDLDKDGNKFLSIEEIFGAMPKRGVMQRDVFEAADRDGNDWMTPQEFVQLQKILVAGPEKVLGKKGGRKPGAKKGSKKGGQANKKRPGKRGRRQR